MLSSMKPDAAEKKPQRPSMTERIKHRRSQAGEDRAPREPVGRVRNTGTRRVHKRLRVAQWVDPPVKIAVSQAAILFDVA